MFTDENAHAGERPAVPNSKAAWAFLERMHPNRLRTVTVIAPDRAFIFTRCFAPDAKGELEFLKWMVEHNGTNNCYFNDAEPRYAKATKLNDEDIARCCYLRIDVDQRPGHPVEEERRAILEMLTTKLPPGVPQPSVVTFSGGGFQAFWGLTEPFELDVPEKRPIIDSRMRGLQSAFRALGIGKVDSTPEPSRIMRLPYTLNNPDDGKRAAGRLPEVACVVCENERRYALEDFPEGQKQQPFFEAPPEVEEEIARLLSQIDVDSPVLTDDPRTLNVSDRLKIIIAQGSHPDPEQAPESKDTSDSGWTYDFVCNAPREGLSPVITFGLLVDERNGISRHVRNPKGKKRRGWKKYALRQVQRGLEAHLLGPANTKRKSTNRQMLEEMNAKHFVLRNMGGKFLVGEYKMIRGSLRPSFQDKTNFCQGYENISVTVPSAMDETEQVSLGNWWLGQRERRQYEDLVLDPSKPKEFDGNLNLWRGFAVEPKQGDWSLFREHIRAGLANGDTASDDYIMNWFAAAVQFPGKPIGSALIFQGKPGTGKSLAIKVFELLFAGHSWISADPNENLQRFNGHLVDVCFLGCNEADALTDKRAVNKFKTLITDDTIHLEGKNMPAFNADNHVKCIMASNGNLVVALASDDRRCAVFKVSAKHAKDRAHFGPMRAQILSPEGLAATLYDLQRRDVSNWNPEDIPKTGARVEQIRRSLTGVDQFFCNWLESGDVFDPRNEIELEFRAKRAVGRTELREQIEASLRRSVDAREVKEMLRNIGCTDEVKIRDVRGMVLPRLGWARLKFNEYIEHEIFDNINVEQDWSGFAFGRPVSTGAKNDNHTPEQRQLDLVRRRR